MSHAQRAYLETQADRAEMVLTRHNAPARVTGGTCGPRLIRFSLQPAPHVRVKQIAALADDLAVALRARRVAVTHGADGVALEFDNPQRVDVGFTLEHPGDPLTALLGLQLTNAPLLLRLTSPNVAHVMVAGTTGSGKSVLLWGLLESLAKYTPARDMQIVGFDPKGVLFAPFGGLPHLKRVAATPEESAEALRSLVHLMEQRDKRHEATPHVLAVVDELADVVMTTPGAEELLTRLVQRGRSAGIHVLAATQRPSAAVISGLMRANFPVRLVGRVVSADDARIAAGIPKSGAERLTGRGDFLCIANGEALRFQARAVTAADIQTSLGTTLRPALPVVAATPPAAWKPEPETVAVLPVVAEADTLTPQQRELVELLLPNWGLIRERWLNEYGYKSKLFRAIFDGADFDGSRARNLEAAAAYLETRRSSARSSAGEKLANFLAEDRIVAVVGWQNGRQNSADRGNV